MIDSTSTLLGLKEVNTQEDSRFINAGYNSLKSERQQISWRPLIIIDSQLYRLFNGPTSPKAADVLLL